MPFQYWAPSHRPACILYCGSSMAEDHFECKGGKESVYKTIKRSSGLILSVAGVASGQDSKPTKFIIRIENTTKPDVFTASNGAKWSLGFSPGVAVVHTDKSPIFNAGKKDRGKGLEAQSEDGNPDMLARSLDGGKGIKSIAVFNTPSWRKSSWTDHAGRGL